MKKIDERLLTLIHLLKSQNNIKTLNEFCEGIGILRQTVHKIRKGEASFTVSHIDEICKKYNVNANWIFGIESNVFMSKNSMILS